MKKLFKETQKVKQAWVIVLMLSLTIFSILNFVKMPLSFASIAPLVIIFLGNLFLISLKLTTLINKEGIYFQLFPLHFKIQYVNWSDIATIEVRKYKPMKEYGGWGYRYSFNNGKAYNISGNMGLQLVLKNGDKILIGTQKKEELLAFLENN